MFIDINGIKTNYSDSGNGEIILLLQGWGTEISLYSGIIEEMSKKYRVIAPELPGFGQTEEPKEPWAVDDYVKFVLDFAKALGIDSAILFGHSFGGRLIIKMLSDKSCPLVCSKAILTGAAGIKPVQSEAAKKKASSYQRGKAFLSTAPMKALFPNALDKLREKHGSADYRAASPLMRQVLVKVVNEDLSGLLPLIDTEVLLIWGENDDATPLSDGKRMEKEMKNAGLAVINGTGHYSFLENPLLFRSILASYLGL